MAAPSSGAYSFLDVNVSISGPGGSFSISDGGVGDDAVRIAMAADKNTMTIGAHGAGMHSLRASKAGRITFTLLKTASVNAQLNAMYRGQAGSSANWGQNVITITNLVSGDAITATACAFVRQTDLAYTTEGGNNVWAFDCVEIDEVLGNYFVATNNGSV